MIRFYFDNELRIFILGELLVVQKDFELFFVNFSIFILIKLLFIFYAMLTTIRVYLIGTTNFVYCCCLAYNC